MGLCTRVELQLEPDVVHHPSRVTIHCNLQGHENFDVTFEDYVGSMVAGIDVSVVVVTDGGRHTVHEGFPPEHRKRGGWLGKLSYVHGGGNEAARIGLTRAIPRLREIRDGEKCYGLAAVDVLGKSGGLFLSGKAVGGLVDPHNRYDDSFVGLMDHFPASAKRVPGERAAPQGSMERWMAEQIALLKNANMSPPESIFASYSIRELGFDPSDVLQCILLSSEAGVRIESIHSISRSLRSGLRLGFPVPRDLGGNHLDPHSGMVTIPGMWTCVVMKNGKFNNARLAAGVPRDPTSLIGIVHRVLVNSGENPTWLRRERVYKSLLGQGDCLEVCV